MATVEIYYGGRLEGVIRQIQALLQAEYNLGKRALALLLLQGDTEVHDMVRSREGGRYRDINTLVRDFTLTCSSYPDLQIAQQRQQVTRKILRGVISKRTARETGFSARLNRWLVAPLTGIPILLVVLLVFYLFVGVLGAGIMVAFIEDKVFVRVFNPFITAVVEHFIPWESLQRLFVGEFGLITMGLRYATAIILPIAGAFFLFFSLLEDTGYFPRLAMLIDGLCKRIGLNGRAVIPLALGLGCGALATLATRILETRRERVIATFLLSLAIPCSAQLGVIMGLLASTPQGLLVWFFVITAVFLSAGYLVQKLIPGEKPSFYMEVPALRLPQLKNIIAKTLSRMEWYFREVLPLFIYVGFVIWVGELIGLFSRLLNLMGPLVRLVGLPEEAALAFVFGFFRRDYGAAGLFDMYRRGILDPPQLVTAAVTLTLFVPCIAQLAVNIKERGLKVALLMSLVIFPFAFAVGFLVNFVLGAGLLNI